MNASFIALSNDQVVGILLAYSPGTWIEYSTDRFKAGLTFKSLNCPIDNISYLKTCLVHSDYQNKGLGEFLFNKMLCTLREMGSQAVLCHSWKESPSNSSQRFFLKIGFKKIKEHPNLWCEHKIDFICSHCRCFCCTCTAVEMIKLISACP